MIVELSTRQSTLMFKNLNVVSLSFFVFLEDNKETGTKLFFLPRLG